MLTSGYYGLSVLMSCVSIMGMTHIGDFLWFVPHLLIVALFIVFAVKTKTE